MAYNDLQMRAFTQIAYMDLEERYIDYCKRHGTDKAPLSAILSDKSSSDGKISEIEKLRRLGVTEKELNEWCISAVHDTNSENGFYACVIETSPGQAAVGFRGSEDMQNLDHLVNDWIGADIGLVNSTCTNQHEEVERFLSKYRDKLKEYDGLAMTGHSLGGNLAEYATIVSYKYGLDDNITQCVSMDGPGFSEEFIEKYRTQIENMSGIMDHPRWSLVGPMLEDLPGVHYRFVDVSNDANQLDDAEYNVLTRHDTKYLRYDENGNLVAGEQDTGSHISSIISKGIEHLPAPVGNAFLTVVSGILIGVTWSKENFLNSDGSISNTGMAIIAGALGIISIVGLETVAVTFAAVVTVMLAVIAVAVVSELVSEFVEFVVDKICDAVEKIVDWAEDKYNAFKDTAKLFVNKIKSWLKEKFSSVESYLKNNTQIKVNTESLDLYAERLERVNKRITKLDNRMDKLYLQVGLLDLFNIIQADLLTHYSNRLEKAANWMRETSKTFAGAEKELKGALEEG